MSCFVFTDSILSGQMLKVIVRGNFSPGFNCAKYVPVKRGFSVEVEPNILVVFKKRSEIK